MLLYLTIAFLFLYNTPIGTIIMDFTLATILGDNGGGDNYYCRDYATLVRSCVTRANYLITSSSKSTSAKNMQQQQQHQDQDQQNHFSFLDHRDSLVVYNDELHKNSNKNKALLGDEDDDDETASTVDMDEDEFPVSPCPSPTRQEQLQRQRRSVQFETELVTAVYTRPRTTKEDKYYLHYDEYDYMDFKLEYRDDLLQSNGRRTSRNNNSRNNRHSLYYRKSPRKVSFKRDVVDSVHPVMDRSQRKSIQNDLFYSEQEMRTFLDEFVVSLQKQSLQQNQQHQQKLSSTSWVKWVIAQERIQ